MRVKPIVIAGVVALVGMFILYNYIVRFNAEASGGTKVQVLWMNRPQEAGSILKDDNLSVRDIPIAYLEPRSVRAADRQRVVGLRLPQALKVRAMLLWSDVQMTDGNNGIEIQAGMRAFTIHIHGKSATLVAAGDRVDIIATFEVPGTGLSQVNMLRQGTVLLQNVLVLAHGQGKTAGASDTESSDLSISVTLQQAEMLALAVERGSLSVALRNSMDLNFFDQITTLRSDQLLDLDPKAPKAAVAGPTGPRRF
jgi:pilus assembly protein CpaB